jgi:hypothetical protein
MRGKGNEDKTEPTEKITSFNQTTLSNTLRPSPSLCAISFKGAIALFLAAAKYGIRLISILPLLPIIQPSFFTPAWYSSSPILISSSCVLSSNTTDLSTPKFSRVKSKFRSTVFVLSQDPDSWIEM